MIFVSKHKKTFLCVFFLTLLLCSIFSFITPSTQAFDPDTDIFFEYGAETGIVGTQIGLQPPWDAVKYGWPIKIDDTHTRGGTKSICFKVTPSGTQGEGDTLRRAFIEEYPSSHGLREFYFSWWVYFDDVWANDEPSGSYGGRVGDVQMWFKSPLSDANRWWGARFGVEPDGNREIYISWVYHKFPETYRQEKVYRSGKYLQGTGNWRNTWIQFQIYIKVSTNPSVGRVRAWIYNPDTGEEVEVMDRTCITDPRGYSRWNTENFYFQEKSRIGGDKQKGSYEFGPKLYVDYENQHGWIWVDDVVGSSTKVSESYGVVYPVRANPDFTLEDITTWYWIDSTHLFGGLRRR